VSPGSPGPTVDDPVTAISPGGTPFVSVASTHGLVEPDVVHHEVMDSPHLGSLSAPWNDEQPRVVRVEAVDDDAAATSLS